MGDRMSASARLIYDEVLSAMQHAEEMGGVRDHADYVALMEAIRAECWTRICASHQGRPW
jgi:hypothetical protein